MKLAVVGATGLVGQKMRTVIEERKIKYDKLFLVASQKSVGIELEHNGNKKKVLSIEDVLEQDIDAALFSAGGETSKEWAPKFAEKGIYVIDNSSAWRMEKGIKLVVPEVNGGILEKNDKIIANPNCSTIQLVVSLNPLHKKFGLKRIIISTYQSVTGTGTTGLNQLMHERAGEEIEEKAYPYQIDLNCIPQCDEFLENGYTKEEMKLVNESRKIMGIDNLLVTTTAVRVPVIGGHSETVYAEFEQEVNAEKARSILRASEGIEVIDNPQKKEYPMPLHAKDRDQVFVGRIRRDISNKKALNFWVVSDNLRKGAATNAVQILEILMKKRFV